MLAMYSSEVIIDLVKYREWSHTEIVKLIV